jgi:hypothetical protein
MVDEDLVEGARRGLVSSQADASPARNRTFERPRRAAFAGSFLHQRRDGLDAQVIEVRPGGGGLENEATVAATDVHDAGRTVERHLTRMPAGSP